MMYQNLSRAQLLDLKKELSAKYDEYKAAGLKLDMSRGRPGKAQLDIALDILDDKSCVSPSGFDCRNYGILDGLPELKEVLAEAMRVPAANIFIGADINENLDDEVHITVIATGFGSEYPIDGETVVKAPQNRTTASVSGTANLYGAVVSENKGEVKPPKAADWFGDKLSSMKTPEAAAPVPQDLSFLEEDEPEIPVFLKKAPKRTPRG